MEAGLFLHVLCFRRMDTIEVRLSEAQLGHYLGTMKTGQFLQGLLCNLATFAMLDIIARLADTIWRNAKE